jgi:hypothetical protein
LLAFLLPHPAHSFTKDLFLRLLRCWHSGCEDWLS